MRQGLYVTVRFPSVCLSVRLSVPSIDRCMPLRRVCCCVGPMGGCYLSITVCGRAAGALRAPCCRRTAGAVLQAPALSSKCGQRHVESRRRRLNTDFCSTSTPSYLRRLIQDRHNVQSTTTTLCQPFTTTTFAKRAYRCSAPAVWNTLLKTVLKSDSVAVFQSRLKTFLFSQTFYSFSAH